MSELNTVARPYARAAFETALESKALNAWADFLHFAAQVVNNAEMKSLLDNPRINKTVRTDALLAVCADRLPEHGKGFIELLATNGRLPALPEICGIFLIEKARHEKSAEVKIVSAMTLSDKEKSLLTDKLANKWGKSVIASYEVDSSLIGGVIIRGNDVVIDGSVRGKLQRMADTLRA